jgi:anthranilate synthase/aminodeoxychorismate synthase-like glutamine amidotransferase
VILIIDNYDSFAYNLVQYFGELGRDSIVYRNDAVTLDDIEMLSPSHIVISPGPCTPNEAGISNDVVGRFKGRIPILGICLGHQCIGFSYGGRIVRAGVPVHGKQSLIFHDGQTIFHDLTSPFPAGRYHSLAVAAENVPDTLEVSARTAEGEIMGLRDRAGMVEGIQFHPESILTPCGHDIPANFLEFYRRD